MRYGAVSHASQRSSLRRHIGERIEVDGTLRTGMDSMTDADLRIARANEIQRNVPPSVMRWNRFIVER